VDNSVPIPASSRKARVNLSQHIIRYPVSLQRILYARSNGTIVYKTKYNAYWKENIKLFKANDFITELTQHIPPKHKHLIRYYGLFSSRTKGKAHKDGSLAKYGYRARLKKTIDKLPDIEMQSVSTKTSRRSWARLTQVYEVDPMCRDAQESEEPGGRQPTFGMSEMWERNIEDATGTGGACGKSYRSDNRSV
jgi:hypothetical protein